MLRYRADRLPVAVFTALTSVDVFVYLLVDELWLLLGYFATMVIPKGLASVWSHHHQHVPSFRSPLLNRALEIIYGLHTGMPTNMWLLHHVLGHHLNYLDQTRDESAWKRRDGTRMGELEYTVRTVLTAYPRAFAVGRHHPRALRLFVVYGTLTWGLALLLVSLRPLPGLLVFLLPMIVTMFYTAWVTYDHHVGLESEDAFGGSYNIMNRRFNRLTGNLGYHTAHHYRQGVHWSRLPELHQQIKHRIPEHCFTTSVFDGFLPDPCVLEKSGPVAGTPWCDTMPRR